jgi:hypothetical protein
VTGVQTCALPIYVKESVIILTVKAGITLAHVQLGVDSEVPYATALESDIPLLRRRSGFTAAAFLELDATATGARSVASGAGGHDEAAASPA